MCRIVVGVGNKNPDLRLRAQALFIDCTACPPPARHIVLQAASTGHSSCINLKARCCCQATCPNAPSSGAGSRGLGRRSELAAWAKYAMASAVPADSGVNRPIQVRQGRLTGDGISSVLCHLR